ncbi:uncharacterized protein LOC134933319 isoform X3 [Pseudophryne corroboree]|uniref:uncharacterized protein LOC134933319 isoform X3 n=1 Tax=Pseudophryne corroboree TaxID=495146 RepID=UPI00308147F4
MHASSPTEGYLQWESPGQYEPLRCAPCPCGSLCPLQDGRRHRTSTDNSRLRSALGFRLQGPVRAVFGSRTMPPRWVILFWNTMTSCYPCRKYQKWAAKRRATHVPHPTRHEAEELTPAEQVEEIISNGTLSKEATSSEKNNCQALEVENKKLAEEKNLLAEENEILKIKLEIQYEALMEVVKVMEEATAKLHSCLGQ